ncbi:MAG: hypothetical protein R3F49_06090 [Planctomycetota bacterium]
MSADLLTFRATNVTGTRTLDLEVARDVSARSVAEDLMTIMQLPNDVSWVLRNDRSAAFLDEAGAIGDQLEPGTRVTLTPRAHLG